MEKLLVDFASPYWWLSVVVVGLLINLASAYLKEPLDAFRARRSEKSRAANEARQTRHAHQVNLLADSPELLILESQDELRTRLQSIIAAIFGVVSVAVTSGDPVPILQRSGSAIFLTVLTVASLIAGLYMHAVASSANRLVRDAHRLLYYRRFHANAERLEAEATSARRLVKVALTGRLGATGVTSGVTIRGILHDAR